MDDVPMIEILAEKLNKLELRYPVNLPKDITDFAATNGLVIVYGASDDLMELRGAITDEVDCCRGGTAYFDEGNLLMCKCGSFDCPYFALKLKEAAKVKAVWGGHYSWTYETSIPHATFEVTADGEPYCRGIVFSICDI